MVQNIIFALVIIFLMAGAFFWMWKLSKWLVIPIQIILFVLLVTVVFKVFVNKDNAKRLNDELAKSGIAEVEKRTISGAFSAIDKHNATPEQKPQSNAVENVAPAAQEVQQVAAPVEKKKPAAASGEVNFVDML